MAALLISKRVKFVCLVANIHTRTYENTGIKQRVKVTNDINSTNNNNNDKRNNNNSNYYYSNSNYYYNYYNNSNYYYYTQIKQNPKCTLARVSDLLHGCSTTNVPADDPHIPSD